MTGSVGGGTKITTIVDSTDPKDNKEQIMKYIHAKEGVIRGMGLKLRSLRGAKMASRSMSIICSL